MLEHGIEANSVTLNGKKYGKLIKNLPPNMKPTIFGMAVKADYALPDDYDFLIQYEPPQPQTNADRIRAMSDEELAELFEMTYLIIRKLSEMSNAPPLIPAVLSVNIESRILPSFALA